MSYFLCLAFPAKLDECVRKSFDARILQTDASVFPIGKTTRGPKFSWKATLLQVDFSSASLIGKASVRKTHNNDHTELFVSGVQTLFKSASCTSVSFLAHWMQGYINTEEVTPKAEQSIKVSDLAQIVTDLEEDVRYTILAAIARDHPYGGEPRRIHRP